MKERWVALALANVALGFLVIGLYYLAAWLSPRLFPKTYSVDTGTRVVAVRRGMSREEVVRLLGHPREENATALRNFREWIYPMGRKSDRVYKLVFEGDRLDAVTTPGERRPVPWRRGRVGLR